MAEPHSFGPLLLVVFLAFVVPLVLSRFKRLPLPIVVGEILAGIAVGRSGLGWVQQHDASLDLLAEFGFVFLMFLSGMEIDFSSVGLGPPRTGPARTRTWGPVPLGILSFLLTLGLSGAIGVGLTRAGLARNEWMMALILSTTSLGVVMPVLKERGLIAGRFGQTLLVAALVADFATMLLITVVVAVLSTGLTVDILLIGLLFVAFFLTHQFGTVFLNRIPGVRYAVEELSHASAQIKVRAAFTMMLVFVALSEVLGTEVILGAFLAGAIVALLRTPEDVELVHKLEAIGFGFFIPIFFIMVGVEFNLESLASSAQAVLLVPILLGAAVVVKFLPALVFRLSFGWRETLASGALLSARLSLIIAASAIGLRLEVISEPVNAAIILVAIITVTAAPLLFTALAPGREAAESRPVIVAGADDLGVRVAEEMRAHHEQVLVIDPDEQRVERVRRRGLEAVAAYLDREDPRSAPYLDRAQALICTVIDVETNYCICQLARTRHGIDHITAQVSAPSEVPRFRQLGVNALNAATDQAALLVLLARNPAAYSLLTRTDDDNEVAEVVVENGAYTGRALRQVQFPGHVLVLAVRRDGELLVPHGDTEIRPGDHLTLAGSVDDIEVARRLFQM